MKKNIVIVDDHEIFSNGVKMILENNLDAIVIGNFSNGRLAFDYLRSSKTIDLVIVDLNMPEMDGFKFLENIRKANPRQKVIVVSMHHSESIVTKCKELGAQGFLQKDVALPVLLDSIEAILL